MNPEVLKLAKQKIGNHLRMIREKIYLGQDEFCRDRNISIDKVIRIEDGLDYTMDEFLEYAVAVDVYLYFAEKQGKHLDLNDLVEKSRE